MNESKKKSSFPTAPLWACAIGMLPFTAHAQEAPPPATEAAPVVQPAPVEPGAPLPSASDVPPSAPAVDPVTPAPEPVASAPVPTVAPAPAAPVVPAPAAAPAWSPVFTGSYFTRYEIRSGYDDLGVARAPRFLEGDAVFYRLRFGIGTGLLDVGSGLKVGLQFSPQASGVFGTLPNTVNDAVLGLHEGYGRVQGDHVRLDAGRFELNYGDALIIGNLDWNETARSFDGVRARVSGSPTSAWLDLFATVIDEGRPDVTEIADGDVYFVGAYAALGPAVATGFDLDLYALARLWAKTDGLKVDPTNAMSPKYEREAASEATFGARAKQKLGILDYRVETGLQVGSRPGAAPTAMMMPPGTEQSAADIFAYHADAEVGLHVIPDKLRVSVEGLYASGDDAKTKKNEGWDELYPTAHKWQGLSDVFVQKGIKRTNVASGVLHLTASPIKNVTLQADGHLFSRPEKVGTKSGYAGAEVDIGLSYALAKGLKVRGLYAVFSPEDGLYPVGTPAAPATGKAEAAHFGEIELRYDLAP